MLLLLNELKMLLLLYAFARLCWYMCLKLSAVMGVYNFTRDEMLLPRAEHWQCGVMGWGWT